LYASAIAATKKTVICNEFGCYRRSLCEKRVCFRHCVRIGNNGPPLTGLEWIYSGCRVGWSCHILS